VAVILSSALHSNLDSDVVEVLVLMVGGGLHGSLLAMLGE
jgi:hypothetical protein